MTGFAIAARRRPTSCRPILRLAPCGIALSAQGGHSQLAWRQSRIESATSATDLTVRSSAGRFPSVIAREGVDAKGGARGCCGSVRPSSSADAEDLPRASLAGQHASFFIVHGPAAVVEACRRCLAAIFAVGAISCHRGNCGSILNN